MAWYDDLYNWLKTDPSLDWATGGKDTTKVQDAQAKGEWAFGKYYSGNPMDWTDPKLKDFGSIENTPLPSKDSQYWNQISNLFQSNIDKSFPNRDSLQVPSNLLETMSDTGGTLGGSMVALGTYNLMGLNEGIGNYAKSQITDPLTKSNLTPFVTAADVGFENPIVAEKGAVINFSKAQIEKDELIVMPDGSIVDSASKSFHKDMKDTETTDYLPEGTLVFSNKVFLYKKDFEGKKEDLISATTSEYKEGQKPELPKEFRITDIFGKDKKISSAEFIKRVRDKYPTSEILGNDVEPTKKDALTERTDVQNKAARIPYIQAVYAKVAPQMEKTNNEEKPVKANPGLVVGELAKYAPSALNLLGSAVSQWMNYKNKQKVDAQIAEWEKTNMDNLNFGTGLGVLSTLSQDPYIPKKNIDIQRSLMEDLPDRVPYYMKNSVYNQLDASSNLAARNLFENSSSFNQAANAAAAYDANLLNAKSNAAMNFANQDINLATDKTKTKLGYEEKWAGEEQNRVSQILQNLNAIKSGLGDYGMNYANQANALKTNITNAQIAADTNYTNTSIGNLKSGLQGLGQGINAAASSVTTPTSTGLTAPTSDILSGLNSTSTNILDYNKGKMGIGLNSSLQAPANTSYLSPYSQRVMENQQAPALPVDSFSLAAPKVNEDMKNWQISEKNIVQARQVLDYPITVGEIDSLISNTSDPTLSKNLGLVKSYISSPKDLNKVSSDELAEAFRSVKRIIEGRGYDMSQDMYYTTPYTGTDRISAFNWLNENVK